MRNRSVELRDIGLLVLRAGVASVLVTHGTQKLFGWFDGRGLDAAAVFFERNGFTPGRPNATLAGTIETVSGSLIAVGLATEVAGLAAAGTMAVAASTRRGSPFAAANGGIDFPALAATAAASLGFAGAGRLSLDAIVKNRLSDPRLIAITLAATSVTAVVMVCRASRVMSMREDHMSSQVEAAVSNGASDSTMRGALA